ncbi:hypothetical protein ARAF_0507 [Arsenophonus endosymbiont of Aleurodicus floccissimus]|uniref:hypothetical protein n=1 Tax=Arsenophonus endosymbiont of Aleurodicus floccissimus TaxID=2152761 RepID=UPI000EE18CEC|nr:hypothetical protein [Arsenophonus endosymbiont of Aleurodicus floccissimus]SPP31383.1 hypothetical protein ARAF_0507 [Arsenophonus endosymbiont of Aleurodicus floccissimus]
MMRLDNPRIVTSKHPNMGNLVGVTNGSRHLNDSRYLSSIDIWNDDDMETRTFKIIMQCLTRENDYLKRENRRLMKIYREIGGLCRI